MGKGKAMNRSSFKLRSIILGLLIIAIFCMFALRLVNMQIVDGASYAQEAKVRTSVVQTLQAARGEMVDRYGRPLVVNESCFDIIFDKTMMIKGQDNEIILKMFDLFREAGESWIDNLPISETQPFMFVEGTEGSVSRLKKFLELQEYATVEDVMLSLIERYEL